MDADEDTVMTGAEASTQAPARRPSRSLTNTPASESNVNGTAKSKRAESLLASFQRTVVAPVDLVKEIEDHQAATTTTTTTTAAVPATVKNQAPPKSEPGAKQDEEYAFDDDEESDSSETAAAAEAADEVPRLLPRSSLPSGVCYDIRMRYHCEVKPTLDVHPEDPRRIYYIYKELCKAGLVDDPDATRPLVPQPLLRIPARDATHKEISLIHGPGHYEFVLSTKDMSEDELIALESTRDSIYFNTLTFTSAILACGGAIETCKAVVSGRVKNAVAVIRPPGHHAESCQAMGFCLFNNVCVAARVCQKTFGDRCRKIMILDWDVHHGNGVQNAFYDDPNVLYISLHVYKDGTFYPGGEQGNWDHCGEGDGLGKNINIPWPGQGMGDGDYLYAFQEVIMPIGYEFNPDLVIVSAGFDAAAGDELGGCFVTPPCYAHMTSMLMSLADGKVAVCLEGGYNFRSISKSALAVTRTLMGEPPDRLIGVAASNAGVSTVRSVAMLQAKYWQCMYPKGRAEGDVLGKSGSCGARADIIRQYQAKQLYDEHKLTNLYIYRASISKSFENQVLASPNYDAPVPLLVIFHDPPELMGIPDPITNELEAHNCWLADVVKDYIEWAVKKGMAVIDVNVPKHITRSDVATTDKYEGEDRNRGQLSEELAVYLWENYIEPNEATNIFFMGVGDAFMGLANLLANKDRVYPRIDGVVCFVAENAVRAVSSHTNPWLSKWYKENSRVYVSQHHSVFRMADSSKRPSKRYGRILRSARRTLNEMLLEHMGDVTRWLEGMIDEETAEE
ncbi:Histone deacetylase hda1 [Ophidiomyces ophidiicola]|nr:Histone deacetylase hda1 [Ophidiomyces ophidiicola]KAI2145346.1 Histone deacetylase hda1 [Ophidiomyces ophidiicola]KAI2390554.1 Histone deacetylase hda1 [Ophidiomyces ophidiicola]KAI2453676.1 Histone deacetylase hda1 [Ophidiomyces ophidiicola]